VRRSPWRWFLIFVLLVSLVVGGIWYMRVGQYLLIPAVPQTITVPFTVTVPADANIDTTFHDAAQRYVGDTYGDRMRIVATPQFDKRPPELVSQHTDGSAEYYGVLVIDIAP